MALMAAVLLRRGGIDEVRCDAESDPPRRQLGQPSGATRAERRSIVTADRKRQTVLMKGPFKPRANPLDRWCGDLQRDQEATMTVRHGQRIDPLAVAGAE